jgi:CubicO group peptidase (beta-lactamase class C family)
MIITVSLIFSRIISLPAYPMKKLLIATCFALYLSPLVCVAQLSTKESAVITRFSNQLKTDLAKDNLHGSISAAIVKNNKVIWSGAFGYAKRRKNILANTGSIYRIGSITKTFTATLMMLLVEDGKLKLDDRVENYLPEIKKLQGYDAYHKMTFRQLASHTSGLNREPAMKDFDVGPLAQWEAKLLSCIPHTSFNSKPGQQILYSNIGYALLGLAISRAAGVPYMQLVQQRILAPLHMKDTFFALRPDKMGRLAEGMANNGANVNTAQPLAELKGRGYKVPNGGIYTTPRDLAKFVMSLMGYQSLLTAKNRAQMQVVPSGGNNYGFGLVIFNKPPLHIIGHAGAVPGYTAQFAVNMDSKYSVILMRNYNDGSTDVTKVAYDLLREL